MTRPTTAEELLALPIGPAFGQRTTTINGKTVNVPIAPHVQAVFHGDDDLVSACDQDGNRWSLGRYASGEWFRSRQ